MPTWPRNMSAHVAKKCEVPWQELRLSAHVAKTASAGVAK